MGSVARPDVFCGTVVDSSDGLDLNVQQCLLGIEGSKIIFREDESSLEKLCDRYSFSEEDVTYLSPGQFLMPGLVDLHIHAPQFRYAGSNMDCKLLQWLEKITFPTEARYSDLVMAKDVFSRVLEDTVNSGTTTAVYFSTLHLDASLLLSDIAETKGQRAFIGKVNMDTNCPDFYRETTEESKRNTEAFVTHLKDKENPLVQPIITPRFALNCTRQLLGFLGSLAKQHNIPVQSHLAENQEEYGVVLKLFPDCKTYTEVYDKYNLLTPQTVMAHGVHLTQSDINLLNLRGSGIAHCPNSNISLLSGLCDVQRLRKNEIKLGLGTDVAGGYSSSVLDAIRYTLLTSKVLSMDKTNYQILNYQNVFRMATLGGCEVLGIDNNLGTLEVGKQFDALVVDIAGKNSVKYFDKDPIEDNIEKFFYLGDDRNIQQVYVAGKRIK